jgi:hypothetical protein
VSVCGGDLPGAPLRAAPEVPSLALPSSPCGGGAAGGGGGGGGPGVGSSWVPTAADPRSQKVTSVEPAAFAEERVGWKVRQSAWVAVVMSSPAQAPGTRVPAAVHPGHRPW